MNISYSTCLLLFYFIVVSAFLSKDANATHIVGGELNYTCLGDDRYEITLTVYRDCYLGDPGAWFDDPASIGIFNDDNELIRDLGDDGEILIDFPFTEDDTIQQELSDSCFVIPPHVCVHTYTYKDTIELPFREGGYTLVYQRCCRNATILNIEDPLATGATYLVRLSEATLMQCNSNAKFKNWPPIYICVDEPINFDHGAIDPDGDSLVYKLCTPLEGANQIVPRPQPPNNPPYDTVRWITPPYSKSNMLGGVPLEIDPETGFLTGIPNTVGQFVVGVCVEEYRNGELISITRRDFQYNVGECDKTVAAFFSAEFYCENETISIVNNSDNADTYRWSIDAPDYMDSTITSENPKFERIQPGTYNIQLIASNERGCEDTAMAEFEVLKLPLTADFDVAIGECDDSVRIDVINQTTYTDTGTLDTNWYQIVNDTIIDESPPFYFTTSDSVLIVLEMISSNSCSDRDSMWLASPLFEANIPDSFEICNGRSVALNPFPDPSCMYEWMPPDFLNDPNAANPIASPTEDILYSVIVSKDSLCDFTDSVFVNVLEAASIIDLYAMEDSVIIGRTNTVFYEALQYDTLIWIPDQIIINEFSGSVEVLLEETRELTLIAYNESSCNDTARISLQTFTPPCEEPYIFIPNAFSPNDDGKNDVFRVRGAVLETVEGFVYNRWGEKVFTFEHPNDAWDGYYDGKPAPIDGYGYYIQYRCTPGGELHQRKGNVSLIR